MEKFFIYDKYVYITLKKFPTFDMLETIAIINILHDKKAFVL